MVTRLIFVRHGESTGNLERRMFGHQDGQLTDKGRAQAQLTAEYLKDWHFDAVYSSDLIRAYETCKCIMAYHPGIEIIRDYSLRECYIGNWENALRTEIAERYTEELRTWVEDIWNAHPNGGENVRELTARIDTAVWRIAKENPGKTVLITGHAMAFRTLHCSWIGMPYERMNEVPWLNNASVSVIDYDIEKHTTNVVMLNEAGFQGELATTVRPFTELK